MRWLLVSVTVLVAISSANGNGLELIALPEAEHNISSILCIIKFCEKYFRSEKAVIGSLVIVNIQNTTEFHNQLIIMLNENTDYDMGACGRFRSELFPIVVFRQHSV